MASEIKMPQLSDTMNAGKILTWLKKEGDKVARGDVLAEVETEKANLEIEAYQPGVLLKIVTPAGTSANVGEVIAVIGEAGETFTNGSGASQPSNTALQPPATQPSPSSSEPETTTKAPQATLSRTSSSNATLTPERSASDDGGRIKASPLARRLAEQNNIDLSQIQGSGPDGRIVKRDVEASAKSGMPPLAASSATEVSPSTPTASEQSSPSQPHPAAQSVSQTGEGRKTPLSKMRETIARRMVESVTQSPHFYTTISVSMDDALRLRETLKEDPQYKGISVNHLVIKAVAHALAKEPRVNCAMRDGMLYEPPAINIGIITAIEDGLLIPVIREADTLALKDLVFEARAAVDRARAGRPNSSDLLGGSFSISNMGMFDVENFTAIINPGQGAVLAVSSITEEAVVRNGQIAIGKRMKVTLSVDHRIIDGIMAGNFLKAFRRALETPALLFL